MAPARSVWRRKFGAQRGAHLRNADLVELDRQGAVLEDRHQVVHLSAAVKLPVIWPEPLRIGLDDRRRDDVPSRTMAK